MKSKFSSLEELVKEIDNAIATLQGKKQELLKAKHDHKYKNGHVEEVAEEYANAIGLKTFKNYTASIYRDNYDLLSKAAFKADMSISSFLKKRCLLDLKNDKDKYFREHGKIDKFLEERNSRGRSVDRKTIGLSILNKDEIQETEVTTKEFEDMASMYGMKSPKELVRYLVDMFLYKQLAKEKLSNDFGFSKLPFNKCKSSHIEGYSYDSKQKYLFIKFAGSSVYLYKGVPQEIYKGLCDAESKGKYFNEYILPNQKKYEYLKFYIEEE